MKTLNLVVPVPPSVNKYLYPKAVRQGKKVFTRLAETTEAQQYKKKVSVLIKKEIENQKWITPNENKFLDVYIDFYFHRKGCDPNNYLKIIYDVFENCGVYINDSCAKPQTGKVVIDKYHPRLEIRIVENEQIGVFKNVKSREKFIKEYGEQIPKRSFDSLLKKLDEGRITLNIFYDENEDVKIREE